MGHNGQKDIQKDIPPEQGLKQNSVTMGPVELLIQKDIPPEQGLKPP